ncbi:MAG: hypothetical protein HYX37_18400 [Rhizobiales bacterium]|nr:hypothetical protein [Hyphomicrobiales bacterium]
MRRVVVAISLSAIAGLYAGQFASAADMPVYKAPAAVVTDSGYYLWLDGMYDRVRLPAYSLGWHLTTAAPATTDAGVAQTFDQGLNGGGVRGAIGYIMPGTSTRFEFGGSYVAAKGSGSQFTTNTTGGVTTQLLDGSSTLGAFLCTGGGGNSCTISGALSTNYSAWQFNGKVANDWKFGSLTATPSLTAFGGNTRVGQTLNQTFNEIVGGVVNNSGTYSASTTERWTDLGARVGLDVSAPVTPALTVGIGGWVGGASRSTSLSGNDTHTDTAGTTPNASTLSVSDSKTVFLANAETGFAYRFAPKVTLRGFVGLNYDGSVPGIAGPSFTGSINPPTSRTAAHISYSAQTSYYAGGGLLVKW